MNHALVTIIAEVTAGDISSLREAIKALGNPASEKIRETFDGIGTIHFASINVVPSSSGKSCHLIMELSADGTENALLETVAGEMAPWLTPLFAQADGYKESNGLKEFLKSKTVSLRQGYFTTLGLGFAGTPGMSASRIRNERDFAKHLQRTLAKPRPASTSALEVLEKTRIQVREERQWEWAFDAEPTRLFDAEKSFRTAVLGTIAASIRVFLWPVWLFMIAFSLLGIRHDVDWVEVLAGELLIATATLVGIVIIAFKLRKLEEADEPDASPPGSSHYLEITGRENFTAQNHLCVHSVLKPGWIRSAMLRLTFFVIGQLAARHYRPGYLGTLATIHFARWVLVPGTKDLLFFSNYGGSWESYLEDFITKAHAGLTAVWSNTVGYPRTEWLINKGATDGERFKQWARSKQVSSLFWYSAYPDLTPTTVRTNAAIRQGFATAQTEDEARLWWSLFGSNPSPPDALETGEIQALIYGGFKKFPCASCLLIKWENPEKAPTWLNAISHRITFGDQQPSKCAITFGIGGSGLSKLGLSEAAIETFPKAFLQGMAAPVRSRILGDCGDNAPSKWWWGRPGQELDAVLMVYCPTSESRADEIAKIKNQLHAHDGSVVAEMDLNFTDKEPFGFADGISQPIIKGTFRAQRSRDPLNLVEPGEFIMGYPDNRGYFPPSPNLDPALDPDRRLPLLPEVEANSRMSSRPKAEWPRDLGRNGSFLVLRQLEQDVPAFDKATSAWDKSLEKPEGWTAAKMMGRWKDGSPLATNPNFPKTSGAITFPPENDFLYGRDDVQGNRCPFGAHIRRANPRDSFTPESQEQIDISNRHRILRRGRAYVPKEGQKAGLLFACLNSDLERQFEFIQQTWINNTSFHGLHEEMDPLLATGQGDSGTFTIPTPEGPCKLSGLPQFVSVRGGGYFFVPGKRTLQFLAGQRVTARPEEAVQASNAST